MTIRIEDPKLGLDGQICDGILRSLPDWFGIEDAIQHYVASIHQMPTILAYDDHQIAGFLSVKQHNPYASEIYVMAVYPHYHRRGIGKAMVTHIEKLLRGQSVEFLQVKTLSPTHPDPYYAQTRQFYNALGFRPLEEFPTLWDITNPCLLMIKSLHPMP